MFAHCSIEVENPGECSGNTSGDSGGPVACEQRLPADNRYDVVHGVVSCGANEWEMKGHWSRPCKAVKSVDYVGWMEEKMRSQTPNMIFKQRGSDAEDHDAPYHVSISVKYRNRDHEIIVCQGAIIGKRWVLTAASCFDKYPLEHTKGPHRNNPVDILDIEWLEPEEE